MEYAQPNISPGEWDTQNSYGIFDIQKDHLISTRRPDLIIIHKKKRICRIVDVAAQAYHKVKLKESEKKDKYLDLARVLTFIPIVIGALGTVTKGLINWLEDVEITGRVETFQTSTSLRSVRILRRVQETWGDLLSLKFQWKTSTNTYVKNSQGVNNSNNNNLNYGLKISLFPSQ